MRGQYLALYTSPLGHLIPQTPPWDTLREIYKAPSPKHSMPSLEHSTPNPLPGTLDPQPPPWDKHLCFSIKLPNFVYSKMYHLSKCITLYLEVYFPRLTEGDPTWISFFCELTIDGLSFHIVLLLFFIFTLVIIPKKYFQFSKQPKKVFPIFKTRHLSIFVRLHGNQLH